MNKYSESHSPPQTQSKNRAVFLAIHVSVLYNLRKIGFLIPLGNVMSLGIWIMYVAGQHVYPAPCHKFRKIQYFLSNQFLVDQLYQIYFQGCK